MRPAVPTISAPVSRRRSGLSTMRSGGGALALGLTAGGNAQSFSARPRHFKLSQRISRNLPKLIPVLIFDQNTTCRQLISMFLVSKSRITSVTSYLLHSDCNCHKSSIDRLLTASSGQINAPTQPPQKTGAVLHRPGGWTGQCRGLIRSPPCHLCPRLCRAPRPKDQMPSPSRAVKCARL